MTQNMTAKLIAGTILTIASAIGQPSSFTSIDYPGAKSTNASSINARGDIVGSYTDQANVGHGFVLSGGVFATIDYPGAVATQARGINSRGDIVGTHFGPNFAVAGSGGDIHGFLLRAGASLPDPIDYPGHINTIAQHITATGEIVGCYHDHDTMASMHGITWKDGNFSALDGSLAGLNVPASMNNGATPDGGVIAGLYTDMMGTSRSYIVDVSAGTFTPFDFPGSIATSTWDMNPSGEVVGAYRDKALHVHGFLMTGGEFLSIDYPAGGVRSTQALGINPQGDIVGAYVDSSGVSHAFLLTGATHR